MGICWGLLNTSVCTPGLCELLSTESFSEVLSPENTVAHKHYYNILYKQGCVVNPHKTLRCSELKPEVFRTFL